MNEPELCPACGARNDCTLADPRRAGQACWCYSVDIAPAIIEALAPELRNQACLCPRCAGVDAQLRAGTLPRP
ncbi:cysteine-rich CWC family protein [Pseudomonas protegens]|uniref:cysteine-rich CWC family protein n=1 Tax=Pseudomonas protegens TaxID=380021 RepID=UPI001E3C973D|nr:cysteine-rich CWC family protein [Pseudomonas protegens]MCD9569210.1 cysteine-rich CWC family protein [Pseudomonas protegens]